MKISNKCRRSPFRGTFFTPLQLVMCGLCVGWLESQPIIFYCALGAVLLDCLVFARAGGKKNMNPLAAAISSGD